MLLPKHSLSHLHMQSPCPGLERLHRPSTAILPYQCQCVEVLWRMVVAFLTQSCDPAWLLVGIISKFPAQTKEESRLLHLVDFKQLVSCLLPT